MLQGGPAAPWIYTEHLWGEPSPVWVYPWATVPSEVLLVWHRHNHSHRHFEMHLLWRGLIHCHRCCRVSPPAWTQPHSLDSSSPWSSSLSSTGVQKQQWCPGHHPAQVCHQVLSQAQQRGLFISTTESSESKKLPVTSTGVQHTVRQVAQRQVQEIVHYPSTVGAKKVCHGLTSQQLSPTQLLAHSMVIGWGKESEGWKWENVWIENELCLSFLLQTWISRNSGTGK